jgi:hypothetical protein
MPNLMKCRGLEELFRPLYEEIQSAILDGVQDELKDEIFLVLCLLLLLFCRPQRHED